MTFVELADGLRGWSNGNRRLGAAVGLLIAHRVWVDRATAAPGSGPFLGARLFYRPIGTFDVSVIDWGEARRLVGGFGHGVTGQDVQVLSIVIAIAGERRSNDPFDLVGLNDTNLRLVTDAFAHYFGTSDDA